MANPFLLGVWFTLGSVGMLAVAIAAAIPILLHWRARPKLQELPWAASFLLEAALQKVRGRWGIQAWWLLALRILAIALLAVALADPQGGRTAPVAASGLRTHLVFLLDNTFSMDVVDASKGRPDDKRESRFHQAREAIRRRVLRSTEGDRFSLVTLALPATIITSESPAADLFLRELDNVELSCAAGDPSGALRSLESLAQTKIADRTEIAIATDSQASSWRIAGAEGEIVGTLDGLSKLGTVQWYDVGGNVPDNLAIESISCEDELPTTGRELTFAATIMNHGPRNIAGARVEWFAGEESIANTEVEVAAGQSATIYARHKLANPGQHVVKARLSDDAIVADNVRWLVATIPQRWKVAAVAEAPTNAVPIVAALDAAETSGEPIDVETISPGRFVERFHEFDGMIICDVAGFSASDAAAIRHAIHRGMGAVFLIGNAAQSANYNRVFGSGQESQRVLPLDLDAPVKEGDFRLDPLEYKHAIVRPFAGFERAGLVSCPIWRYLKGTVIPGDSIQRVADFSSGDVAAACGEFGRGRVCVWLTSPSLPDSSNREPWSALGEWPCFPPLVSESVIWSLEKRYHVPEFRAGEELVVELEEPANNDDESDSWAWTWIARQSADSQMKEGESGSPIVLEKASAEKSLRLPPVSEVGVLRFLRSTDDPAAPSAAAFASIHVDTEESNLQPLDKQWLPRAWRQASSELNVSLGTSEQQTIRWSPWLIVLVGVLFLWETAWSARP
jgi:hypothetical protein